MKVSTPAGLISLHKTDTTVQTYKRLPKWEYEEIFFRGDDYYKGLLTAIYDAQSSIRFETYIFANDKIGETFTYALYKAAKRGVSVHIIIDGIGSASWSSTHQRYLTRAGCRIKTFHPLPWKKEKAPFKAELPQITKRFFKSLYKINKRNHRKLCIIDDRIAFVGSMNITGDHSEYYNQNKAWRDTSLRVEGAEVRKLIYAFDRVWYGRDISRRSWQRYKDEHYYRPHFNIVRTNDSFFRRRFYNRDLLRRFREASERVWITTPYFLPSRSHLKELLHAAERGLDVRLLVGRKNDVFLFKLIHPTFYRKLIKSGVKVFEYLPSVIHAKNIIVDRWTIVGSSNFNSRSLIHDLEVDVVLTKTVTFNTLTNQYRKDFENSKQITMLDTRKISPLRLLIGNILFLLRYWL